jgi:DNA-damage-inducible protein J
MSTVVRARVDEKTKDEATAVLATTRLTVSDAFRLMVVRIPAEQKLASDPFVSNAETIAAMKTARRGDLVSHERVEDLMVDLNADD